MGWDISKKIHQLIAKAESTNSPAEAEACMVKVRELLDKHGLSLLTIKHSAASDDPVESTRRIYGYWRADHWMRQLSAAVADYYGVRIVWSTTGNYTSITAIGRESCRAAFAAMLPYLRAQVIKIADRGWYDGAYPTKSKARTQVSHALTNRLRRLVWNRQSEYKTPEQQAGLGMLVPVDQIEITMKEEFPNIRTLDLQQRVGVSRRAHEDAASINLADQVEGKNPRADGRLLG